MIIAVTRASARCSSLSIPGWSRHRSIVPIPPGPTVNGRENSARTPGASQHTRRLRPRHQHDGAPRQSHLIHGEPAEPPDHVARTGRGVVPESMGGRPQKLSPAELERLAKDTEGYWKSWLARSTYTGRWREMVDRSAITLKLMTYAPTGAPVAAPAPGLPEQAGGERNWDYRFTWIRDGSLTMHALAGLGYLDEAARFGVWLKDRVTEGSASNGSSPLKIMYRVDGSSDLIEETLGHFEGWRGSRPVRIGNGAADQLQLDIYGEAMDAILTSDDVTQDRLDIRGYIDTARKHGLGALEVLEQLMLSRTG
jgi:hypothetical protein